MIKTDPIIAVKDVQASSEWYQSLLECKGTHGGDKFEILRSKEGDVILCLHYWYGHNHPTMSNPNLKIGNGLILYIRVSDLEKIRDNAKKMSIKIEEEIHMNKDSRKDEFSVLDPDGYYLTFTEYHDYEG